MNPKLLLTVVSTFFAINFTCTAAAFEGRIRATLTRGGAAETYLYTVGTNSLRVERGETNWPYTVTLVNRDSGTVTLLFANNRSFVHLKPATENSSSQPPGFPAMPRMPAMPSAASAPSAPAGIGPTNLPGMPTPPAMPPMPAMSAPNNPMPAMPMIPMMGENPELTATSDTTNLLGYTCTRYELKSRGEMMEIWATATLLPFPPYQANQMPRFGPRMIEEQWGGLVQAKKLFPLLAVLRFDVPVTPGQPAPAPGPERLRYEVKSITPAKLTDDEMKLLAPPEDYQEIQPLPF